VKQHECPPGPSGIRLVAFDLDGTLLRGDTVCEVLARRLGRLDRMRELEATATDLEAQLLARAEMVSWYEDHTPAELQDFAAQARLAPGAREGFALLVEAGIEIAILSVTWGFAVEWFAGQLGASAWIGTSLEPDGSIGHVWPEDKSRWLESRLGTAGLSRRQVAAVGDSRGDLPLLHAAGLPVFVGPELLAELPTTTRHLPAADVRDIARLILDCG
jgi:phosphoserine phosphatase